MSSKNSHELKQLKTRLAKAKIEAEAAKEDVRLAQRKESEANRLCSDLRDKISKLEASAPIITEHAMLRYFERVLGYDLEAIQKGLLTDQAVSIMANLKNGKVPSVGCRLVVSNGVVVTVEV